MKWITRERVRMDRTAVAWLVKRFVDPEAVFLFAPGPQVQERAQQEQATPFDVPGVELTHQADKCGADAVLAKYGLSDPALGRLVDIVRGADVAAWKDRFPESAGLGAIIHGFFLQELPDAKVLESVFPLYDALYRYCQDRAQKQP